MSCPRSITFTIPGAAGGPGLQVSAVENNGDIVFTLDVLDTATLTADLRGLFFHFDETLLGGLSVTGNSLITKVVTQANGVIDLGSGNNMIAAASPFDVGIAFGTAGIGKGDDLSGPVTFTLDGVADLNLDNFAHLQFGARLTSIGAPGGKRMDSSKTTAIAPAAPRANDDEGTTHEDVPVTLNVLGNDTDLDGDVLSIINVDPPAHGTVTIAADGKSLTYTPTEDYAGLDEFAYCVSDGHGGTDSAVVKLTVIPVADPPDIKIEVLAAQPNDDVSIVRLKVTATQTDLDGSEFIDRIEINGVPAGVVLGTDGDLNPAGQPDSVTEFITLQLPDGQDVDFDLSVTAFSEEEGDGDPDTASATVEKKIEVAFTHNEAQKTFVATDQNIWDEGDAFVFHESHFFGVDEAFNLTIPSIPNPFIPGGLPPLPVSAGASGHLKIGFQATVHIDGGSIDATLPYDLTVDTTYNKTTDRLLIRSDAVLTGGDFKTTGPGGFLSFQPIVDFFISVGGSIAEIIDLPGLSGGFTLADIPEDLVPPDFTFDSDDASWSFPAGYPGLVGTFQWPHVQVTGAKSGDNELSGDTDLGPGLPDPAFLSFDLDVETLAIALFPLLGPLDLNPADPGSPELTDFDLGVGLALLQEFVLSVQRLEGTIKFEDGHEESFIFGEDRTFDGVSAHDANHDGQIGYTLSFSPKAMLDNATDIGVLAKFSFDFLKNIPILEEFFNPLIHVDGAEAIPVVEIFGDEFPFAFDNSASVNWLA